MEPLFQIHLSPKLQRCIIFPPTPKIAQFLVGFEKSMYPLRNQCFLFLSRFPGAYPIQLRIQSGTRGLGRAW